MVCHAFHIWVKKCFQLFYIGGPRASLMIPTTYEILTTSLVPVLTFVFLAGKGHYLQAEIVETTFSGKRKGRFLVVSRLTDPETKSFLVISFGND